VHRVDEPVDVARRYAVLPPDTEHLHAGLVPVDQGSIRPVRRSPNRATRKPRRLSTDLHLEDIRYGALRPADEISSNPVPEATRTRCCSGRVLVDRVDWTCAEVGPGIAMDAEKRRRLARREFIRDHHPDRGGDPDEFIAGLAELDVPESAARPQAVPPEMPPRVVFEDQPWPRSAITALWQRLRRPSHGRPPH
jgi:hypothetical protein